MAYWRGCLVRNWVTTRKYNMEIIKFIRVGQNEYWSWEQKEQAKLELDKIE